MEFVTYVSIIHLKTIKIPQECFKMEFAIPNYTKTDCLFQSLPKSGLFTNVIKKSKNTSIMKKYSRVL